MDVDSKRKHRQHQCSRQIYPDVRSRSVHWLCVDSDGRDQTLGVALSTYGFNWRKSKTANRCSSHAMYNRRNLLYAKQNTGMRINFSSPKTLSLYSSCANTSKPVISGTYKCTLFCQFTLNTPAYTKQNHFNLLWSQQATGCLS